MTRRLTIQGNPKPAFGNFLVQINMRSGPTSGAARIGMLALATVLWMPPDSHSFAPILSRVENDGTSATAGRWIDLYQTGLLGPGVEAVHGVEEVPRLEWLSCHGGPCRP
jgi:hypothetical protein